jgi:hypothetical protein
VARTMSFRLYLKAVARNCKLWAALIISGSNQQALPLKVNDDLFDLEAEFPTPPTITEVSTKSPP